MSKAKLIWVIIAAVMIFFPFIQTTGAAAPYDWLQFDGDSQHSGNNLHETGITPGNVANLHKLFQVSLPSPADGAPVYLNAVKTPSGTRSLLFVTTRDGSTLALDANTGARVWAQSSPAGACRVNKGAALCFTTSSPAVDPNRQYVYSYGLDGKVHKYQVSSGAEVTTGGWPETATLQGYDEKGSSSLAIATDRGGQSYLYAANSGYPGDQGNYQGHLTVINLSDGSQKVFNALCSNQAVHFSAPASGTNCPQVTAGIWSRAPLVYDPDTNRIYVSTGNGDFNPAAHDWGDTVFALNADGSGSAGSPLDTYTPVNFQQLSNTDTDLGSTAPAILPAPAGSRYPHLAVMGGKDQNLRLLNLDQLSGKSGIGHTGGEIGAPLPVPQGGAILTQPAVWTNPQDNSAWVFVTTGFGTAGLRLIVGGNGLPSLAPVWNNRLGATSPLVANGILFEASSGSIRALNPLTGSVLWSNSGIGGIHWESPIAASGRVYITDESGNLTAYTP